VPFRLIAKRAIQPTRRRPAYIAIREKGRFYFNTSAVEILNREGEYRRAFLFWDEDRQVVAIRPTKMKDPRAYLITYSSSGRGACIAAKSFFQMIGYDYSKGRSFEARWNQNDAGFEIDMTKPEEATAILRVVPRPLEPTLADLETWYVKADACRRLRVAKRTFEYLVKQGQIERRWKTRPHGRGEPVFKPEDVEKVAESRSRSTA